MKFPSILNPQRPTGFQDRFRHDFKIVGMGPEQDRNTESGGFQHIMTPDGDEASTHKGHAAKGIDTSQLAHRIQNKNVIGGTFL